MSTNTSPSTASNSTAPGAPPPASIPIGLILKLPRPESGDIDIGYQIEVAATVTFIFAFFAVALRCTARWKYAKLGWDDYLMVFAVIQALLATISDYIAVSHGLGRHIYFLTISQFANQQLWQFIAQTFCLNALTCGKVSLCLTYLRIMRGGQHSQFLRWSIYFATALTFVINSLVVIAQFAQCMPASKSWNPFVQGVCWQPPAAISLVLLQGAVSALTDYYLAAFPFVLFKELQVSRSTKNLLLILMSLGAITGVFATIRSIENGLSLHSPTAIDMSFNSITGLMWAGMERNVALMVASIPPIRPLAAPVLSNISKILTSGFTTRSSTTKNSSRPNYGGGYELNSTEKSSTYVRTNEIRTGPPNTFRSGKDTMISHNTIVVSGAGSQEHILRYKQGSIDEESV